MEDLKKLNEFLSRLKQIKREPRMVTQRQAAELMGCSTRTVREYARRCNVRMIEFLDGKYYYHLHSVKKMILRRDYNDYIRRFEKKFRAGYYAGNKNNEVLHHNGGK